MRGSWVTVLPGVALLLSACGGGGLQPDAGTDARRADAAKYDSGLPDSVRVADAGVSDAGVSDAYYRPDRQPLSPGTWALSGTAADLPYDDLAPLGTLIAGASYVGLGESVHTSGGFYATKHRLIRYLVDVQGFRVFAMETPRTAARRLDEYITTCGGSAEDALKAAIFSVFADDNTAALALWLCQRNAGNPSDPVRFFGFDAQQPEQDLAEVRAFLTAAAPADATALLDALDPCRKSLAESIGSNGQPRLYPQANYEACVAGLTALSDYLSTNEAALTASTSAEQLALARVAVVSFGSWQPEMFFYTSDVKASFEARDVAMASIFQSLVQLYYPGQKTILWAHDYHLAARHLEVTDDEPSASTTMGTELTKALGTA